MRKTIAIYADQESKASSAPLDQEIRKRFPANEYDIISIDRHALSDPAFYDNLYMLVIPGIQGETSRYHEHIGPNNHLIRQWLQNGGKLTGLCAGANHIGSFTLWAPEWAEHRSRKPDEGLLSVFSGITHGPVPGIGVDGEDPNYWRGLTCTTIELTGSFRRVVLPYSSGPMFLPNQDVNIHGRYVDHPDSPPAIISFGYGEGFVLLSGPLPQYGATPEIKQTGYEKLNELYDRIRPYEQDRVFVLDYLMNLIRNSSHFTSNPELNHARP